MAKEAPLGEIDNSRLIRLAPVLFDRIVVQLYSDMEKPEVVTRLIEARPYIGEGLRQAASRIMEEVTGLAIDVTLWHSFENYHVYQGPGTSVDDLKTTRQDIYSFTVQLLLEEAQAIHRMIQQGEVFSINHDRAQTVAVRERSELLAEHEKSGSDLLYMACKAQYVASRRHPDRLPNP